MSGIEVAGLAILLGSFSTSGLLLVQNFVKSADTLQKIQRETVILQYIFDECVDIAQTHPSTLPKSLETSLFLCKERCLDLLRTLEKIISKKSRLQRLLHITLRDQELITSFDSFRDSVLLLRDLSSDLRINRQMLQVSAEIARLLLDEQEQEDAGEDHDSEQFQNEEGISDAIAHFGGPTREGEPASSNLTGRRPKKLERFIKDIGDLLASDFTRDLIVIFETDSDQPSEKLKYVPLRNKIDTFSDDNFISHRVLEKHNVKSEKITPIPENLQTERELTMIGGYKLRPEKEIKLEWYRPKDTQKRETTFIVAYNNPPFDTLICKKDWDTERPNSAFPIFGRRKKPREREEEASEEAKMEIEASELVRKQIEALSEFDSQKGNRKRSKVEAAVPYRGDLKNKGPG